MKTLLTELVRKRSREVDYLEIRLEESEETMIAFRGSSIDTLRQSSEKGGCVRALFKGGWGFASFNNIEPESLTHFIQSAIRQAKLVGHEDSKLAPAPIVDQIIRISPLNDPRNVSLDRKIGILKSYNDLILNMDSRIPMSSVSYGDSFKRVWLATSEGSYLEHEHLDIGGGILPVAVKSGQTQMSSVGFGSSNDFNVVLNLEKQVKQACKNAIELLDAPPMEGGMYTIVADSKLAGVFIHEAFGHTSEGEKVYENKKLAEIMKIGAVFGSPILTVFDSGLETGYRGAIPFDDEGIPTEKTYLIRDGVLVGRLHSRETAGKMGEEPTGNGRALNYKYPPIPRMRNTCIDKGTTSVEDIIKDVKLGVYAVDAMGGQGGEMFSFTAGRGYMIRNGRIEEMVKNVTVSGNLFETLKKIDAIGDDFAIYDSGGGCGKGSQFPLPVSCGSPTIRIRDVVVAGA